MDQGKIVITGTGRCGTTLLVQLLTRLGRDTGFSLDSYIDPRASAGLEKSIESPSAPRIVKDPSLCTRLGPLLDQGLVKVEHVIIPIREFDVAVASRIRASSYGLRPTAPGGLLDVIIPSAQKEKLRSAFYELMHTVARFDLPFTLLAFPRFAKDWEYTYEKLAFMLEDVSPEQFREAFEASVKRDLIHEKALTTSEQTLSVLGAPVSVLRRVAKKLKKTKPR